MKVLVPTDSFPPICGGSGWSTYALARGLRAKGHDVVVVQPRPGTATGPRERQYGEFKVLELGTTASNLPYLRNYDKNEGLYPAVADMLARLISREGFDVVHGQHVMTCLPAIEAAHEAGIPAVCTVRDYWPVCYWSDLIHTSSGTSLCPACSTGMMTRCIRPRGGVLWPLALPMIPYMRANLGRKRAGLAEADAVIAVSSRIASDLRARAPELAETRIEIIPNAVEVAELRAQAAAAPPPFAGPYALYLGKLAPNKGTSHLVDVVERAGLDWPLVIVGDGPDRAAVESAAKRSDRDIRVVGWVGQHQTAAWLGHASMLVFTSRGPESLSRVLIEASALGVPIAAMNTGGTPDIVTHDETGLLSDTPEALAEDVRRLRNDEALRRRLGDGARRRVERDFDIAVVTGRIEALYEQLRRPGGPIVRTSREDPS
jgi:glycosyltransferase involved in cell wall biosynthesis